MSNIPRSPIDILRRGIESYEPYLQPSGELFDPVFGEPFQYGTAYHALGQAVLAAADKSGRQGRHFQAAERGLRAALGHVENQFGPTPLSSVNTRDFCDSNRQNHRDFFWPAILETYRVLSEIDEHALQPYRQRLAQVPVPAPFYGRPPLNWAAVWMVGEWSRMKLGLSSTTQAQFDDWLEVFFQHAISVEHGTYLEHGLSNSYDLFTRCHLAQILTNDYDGRCRQKLERLMETGLRRSLAVQLSSGSLASAHRSSGHTWNLGVQTLYFTLAGNFMAPRDPALASQAQAAARLALGQLSAWQRPDGPYSPVQNLLPSSWRVGYEEYSSEANYGNLTLGMLALAIRQGLHGAPFQHPQRAEPRVWIENEPIYRAVAQAGDYSVHLNARPSPNYEAFGITDVAFGPNNRFGQLGGVRHVASGKFFNIGLALRDTPGRSSLRPLCQMNLHLTDEIRAAADGCGVQLRSRPLSESWAYDMSVSIDQDGIHVTEQTPGRIGLRTLLIPYLLDDGRGQRTCVSIHAQAHQALAQFKLGDELLCCIINAPLEHALDVSYGFDGRLGLFGLLRLDLANRDQRLDYQLRLRNLSP